HLGLFLFTAQLLEWILNRRLNFLPFRRSAGLLRFPVLLQCLNEAAGQILSRLRSDDIRLFQDVAFSLVAQILPHHPGLWHAQAKLFSELVRDLFWVFIPRSQRRNDDDRRRRGDDGRGAFNARRRRFLSSILRDSLFYF